MSSEPPHAISYSRKRFTAGSSRPVADEASDSPAFAPLEPARTISQKALKVLGATEEEVRFERAYVAVPSDGERRPAGSRVYVEIGLTEEEEKEADAKDAAEAQKVWMAPAVADPAKASRVLGMAEDSATTWLARQPNEKGRVLRTKALATLGATIDDVRIEKALLVLGEAPGRQVPAGKLPRPASYMEQPMMWAVPPKDAEPISGLSVFLVAFLPWGVLAPLNLLKLQLNKVSPGAHLWVPSETEQCQAACGVARMWATLFWSMQFANAIASLYLHYHRERGVRPHSWLHPAILPFCRLPARARCSQASSCSASRTSSSLARRFSRPLSVASSTGPLASWAPSSSGPLLRYSGERSRRPSKRA